MVSLGRLFWDLLIRIKLIKIIRKSSRLPEGNDIILVRRLPPRKVLRALQLGLTFALFFAILTICLNYNTLFSEQPWYTAPLIGLLFIMGTLLGGQFVILVGLFIIILFVSTTIPDTLWDALKSISLYYVCGFMFGAIFADLYNDFVFLFLTTFRKDLVKFAFAFDMKKKFNVIKSPIETEEHALLSVIKPLIYYTQKIYRDDEVSESANKVISFIRRAAGKMPENDKNKLLALLPDTSDNSIEKKLDELKQLLKHEDTNTRRQAVDVIEKNIEPLVEKYLKLKARKSYNYRLDYHPPHPYTIAFIANPKILKHIGTTITCETDLIMNNVDLFLRSVDKALYSFETNEVLGSPEIWPYVRIIAVFDENLAVKDGIEYALTQPFREDVTLDGIIAENLLAPSGQAWTNYKNIILENYVDNSGFTKNQLETINHDTDVFFAMSASREFNRSTALFTDYEEQPLLTRAIENKFEYHLDPDQSKNGDIYLPTIADMEGRIKSEHEDFKVVPGRVALNVLGANTKSYIHEFAHAMSSAHHGAIVDEYFDRMEVLKDPGNNDNSGEEAGIPFYVNRIERKKTDNGRVIPVHKIFAKYKGITYYSDREHPSARENWIGYFPDRKTPFVGCIMDRNYYGYYRFDKLITDFMYDRLISKINRK